MHVRQQEASPRTLSEYVDRLQQSGQYSFSRRQALRRLGISPAAFKRAAQRLLLQGRLAAPRRGFFVIVPLEYKLAGSPPPSWFIDQLMRYHAQPYYTGLLSAAALHGAAHQQPQEFQVITSAQLRPAAAGRSRIRFLMKKRIESTPTTSVKTQTGWMRVATPEATAVDLVRYPGRAGGWSNLAEVLAELAEALDPHRLALAAQQEADLAAAQRLGFLLDHVGASSKTGPLAAWVKQARPRRVALRPDREARGAPKNPRWQVLVNERAGGSA